MGADAAERDTFAGESRAKQHGAGDDDEARGDRAGDRSVDALIDDVAVEGKANVFIEVEYGLQMSKTPATSLTSSVMAQRRPAPR